MPQPRKAGESVSCERVRELLAYDPDSGVLRWRVATARSIQVGDIAGCVRPDGYRRVTIDYAPYLASRLIWLWMTGAWPQHQVDHEDRDPKNNRWSNLRDFTPAQNMRNQGPRSNSTSGVRGVSWHKRAQKWSVLKRSSDGKRRSLGYFEDYYTAVTVALAFAKKVAEMDGQAAGLKVSA
jgi:hypothetical protein